MGKCGKVWDLWNGFAFLQHFRCATIIRKALLLFDKIMFRGTLCANLSCLSRAKQDFLVLKFCSIGPMPVFSLAN